MAVVLPVLIAAERAVVELELRLGATLLDELRLGAVAVVLRLWLTEDELRLGDELLLRLADELLLRLWLE